MKAKTTLRIDLLKFAAWIVHDKILTSQEVCDVVCASKDTRARTVKFYQILKRNRANAFEQKKIKELTGLDFSVWSCEDPAAIRAAIIKLVAKKKVKNKKTEE